MIYIHGMCGWVHVMSLSLLYGRHGGSAWTRSKNRGVVDKLPTSRTSQITVLLLIAG